MSRFLMWTGAFLFSLAALVPAQCPPPTFSSDFSIPTAAGIVTDVLVFDDGTGPTWYVAIGPTVARWDGQRFTGLVGGAPLGNVFGLVTALAVYDMGQGPELYAAGQRFTGAFQSNLNFLSRWTGSSWVDVTTLFPSPITAMTVYDDGGGAALYAAGGFPEGIAKWNGTTWSSLSGGVNGTIEALATTSVGIGSQRLVVGGAFTTAGGVPASNIALWDGAIWVAPPGTDGPVNALIEHNDGTPRLFAGGLFGVAGGIAAASLAAWDGVSWSSVGSGVTGEVLALAEVNDGMGARLAVGGTFTAAGGAPAGGFAHWDGTSLQADVGTSGTTFAMAAHNDGGGDVLLVAGGFLQAGDLPVANTARWQPSSGWRRTVEGEGVHGSVNSMATGNFGLGNLLVAAGTFDYVGVQPVQDIAVWDGIAWSALGALGTDVRDLAVFDDGAGPDLYAATTFGLHRYDIGTATWTSIPSGVPIDKLLVFDDGGGPDLYAGGTFTWLNGVFAPRVARFDGAAWSALAAGPAFPVASLAVHDAGGGPELYAGGGPSGPPSSTRVARFDGTSWVTVGAIVGPLTTFSVETLTSLTLGGQSLLYSGGTNRSALWDGISWTTLPPIGVGIEVIHSSAAFDDGTGMALWVGGSDGIVAWWNGATWTGGPLIASPSPVNAMVPFLDPAGEGLYLGGAFAVLGGIHSSGIGRYGIELPTIQLTQPAGSGGGVYVQNRSIPVGHEVFNVFSAEPCVAGVGLGPYGGLCFSNLQVLVSQISLPVGAAPFHTLSQGDPQTFGPFSLSPIILEGVCVDATAGCLSRVTRFTVQ